MAAVGCVLDTSQPLQGRKGNDLLVSGGSASQWGSKGAKPGGSAYRLAAGTVTAPRLAREVS